MARKPRAVAYLRQSTARDESISLELQETACRDYAHRQGYDVVAVEADPGISGRTFARPGVQAVMAMVERGDVDVILLWKWSRWSRNRLDWYVAADKAQHAGGRIESATEPIDTSTSIGRLSRGMMIEIAAFESDRAGDQWREAHERRVRQGRPHHGKNRFGYRYDPVQKLHVPDPDTAPIVEDLYQRYVDGTSIYRLVQWLNQQGIPTVEHAGKRGTHAWSESTLRGTLDNPFPTGRFIYRGEIVDGAHEPIVPLDLWEAYRQKRQHRSKRPRAEASQYLLSGLVRCKACGTVMTGCRATGGVSYYRCATGYTSGNHTGGYVRCSTIESEVKAELRRLASRIDRAAQERVEATRGAQMAGPSLSVLEGRRKRVTTSMANLALQVAEGLPGDAYEEALAALVAKRDALDAQIAAVRAAGAAPAPVGEGVVALLEDWEVLPVAHRREMLGRLFRVTVDFDAGRRVVVHHL
ncbi:hypothetical protein GCM10009592_28260 [Brachybacterium rhamnosum]|uniref:Recombinase family protein n=1 Tax=Brachybacterium rhamnosum TaxID=173361 RepID=A0ABW4Q364_9MICO